MHGLRNISRNDSAHGGLRVANAIHGHAVVESVTSTGVTREDNPEVELVLTLRCQAASPTRRPFARWCRGRCCTTWVPASPFR